MNEYNVIKKIRELSATDKIDVVNVISKNILANLDNIENLSINDLSILSSCSKASIVKYCKLLNLSGYKELIRILVFESSVFSNIEKHNDKTEEKNYINLIKQNIDFLNENYYKGFEILAKEMKTKKRIFLFGKGPNLNTCNIFYNYLIKLNYNTVFSSDLDVQMHMTKNFSEDDIVFIFSYTGTTKQMVEIYKKAQLANSRIVYVGANLFSPIYNKENINFIIKNNEEVLKGQQSAIISFNVIVMQIVHILNN